MIRQPHTKQAGPDATGNRPNASTPSSATSGPIVAPGRLVPPHNNRQHFLLVVTRCPFCRRKHTHGAPDGLATREERRISHCVSVESRTYRILVDTEGSA